MYETEQTILTRKTVKVSLTKAGLEYSPYECWVRLESQGGSRTEIFWISLFQIQPPWQTELQPSR